MNKIRLVTMYKRNAGLSARYEGFNYKDNSV